MQLVLLKAIFRALFEEGQDIGDVSTLAKLAVANKVFTSESEARVWLEGKELEDSVLAMSTHASTKLGITGVPFTVINDKWALNGCISTECFSKVSRILVRFFVMLTRYIHRSLAKSQVQTHLNSRHPRRQ